MTLCKLITFLLLLSFSCKNGTNPAIIKDTLKPVKPQAFIDTNSLSVDSAFLKLVEEIRQNPYSDNYDTGSINVNPGKVDPANVKH